MTIDLTAATEAAARSLAQLDPGEPWPDRTTLDSESRTADTEAARNMLTAALPHIEAALREQVAEEIETARLLLEATGIDPEALRDEIAGWPIGTGYYATQIDVDTAAEIAAHIITYLTNEGETP